MPDQQPQNRQTVLLVDDHPIVRLGVKTLLEDTRHLSLTHVAESNHDAMATATQAQPDIIILDLILRGRSGIEIIQQLRKACPRCRVVVYSSLPESIYATRTIQMGAHAYVEKDSGLETLLDAIYRVIDGNIYVSETIQQSMLKQFAVNQKTGNDLSSLSNQELNVLRLIGEGLRLSEIAKNLGISPKTVGTHRERIKNKLGLNSGKEMERLATSLFAAPSNPVIDQ